MAERDHASLLGRDAELAMLDDAVGSVAQGGSCIVLIKGDPGIGKSTLLDELLTRAREQGFVTMTAFGDPLGARRPLGLLARALGLSKTSPDAARARLAHLLLERADRTDAIAEAFTQGPASLYRITEETLGLVEQLATEKPILFGVDDLQWSDPATLVVLGEMAHRLAHLPFMLVLAFRPLPNLHELTLLLDSLEKLEPIQIRLGPLAPQAVADLAETQLGRRAGTTLRNELAKASGNPFFIKELLQALATDDRLVTSGEDIEVSAAVITPDLQLTLLRRLSFLTTETRQLLRAASVLGKRFDARDVSELIGTRPLGTAELMTLSSFTI
jgi:predicted ATPase